LRQSCVEGCGERHRARYPLVAFIALIADSGKPIDVSAAI
jgi:hypothetical protein